MDQRNNKPKGTDHAGQFQYLDRWVDIENFRAYVYDRDGKQKLANSHQEFKSLMESGLWFASKPEKETSPPKRELKNGTLRSND